MYTCVPGRSGRAAVYTRQGTHSAAMPEILPTSIFEPGLSLAWGSQIRLHCLTSDRHQQWDYKYMPLPLDIFIQIVGTELRSPCLQHSVFLMTVVDQDSKAKLGSVSRSLSSPSLPPPTHLSAPPPGSLFFLWETGRTKGAVSRSAEQRLIREFLICHPQRSHT